MARPTRPGTSRSRAARSIVPKRSRTHSAAVGLRPFSLRAFVQFACVRDARPAPPVPSAVDLPVAGADAQVRCRPAVVTAQPRMDVNAGCASPATRQSDPADDPSRRNTFARSPRGPRHAGASSPIALRRAAFTPSPAHGGGRVGGTVAIWLSYSPAVFPWAYFEIVGAGLAVAGFIVLCLVLFWGRHKAPHYWDE